MEQTKKVGKIYPILESNDVSPWPIKCWGIELFTKFCPDELTAIDELLLTVWSSQYERCSNVNSNIPTHLPPFFPNNKLGRLILVQ